jgi:hypothetical protein
MGRSLRGVIFATTITAVMGLTLPSYAQVPSPMKHGKPVTAAQCKQGGGTVSMGKCKGGTYDGDTVYG